MLNRALEVWGVVSPKDAQAWIFAQDPAIFLKTCVPSAIHGMTANDPKTAWDTFAVITESVTNSTALNASSEDVLVSFSNATPTYCDALAAIFSEWTRSDPEEASRIAASFQPSSLFWRIAIENVADSWGEQDPYKAMLWVSQLKPCNIETREVMQRAACGLVNSDFSEVIRRIFDQSENSNASNEMLAGYVLAAKNFNPLAAQSAADFITNVKIRNHVLDIQESQ
jgi:hypothetical protein